MALTQEMFRFVTTRRPERVAMHRIDSRLIRDRRTPNSSSMLVQLFGRGEFEDKLRIANAYVATSDFLAADDPEILALGPAIDFFRQELAPDVVLADLAAKAEVALPLLTALLKNAPPAALLEATAKFLGRLWDSLYAQTIRGCHRYLSTNYLADSLRVYHVLRLLWLSRKLKLDNWAGGGFDEYDVLIDLNKAIALADNPDQPTHDFPHPTPQEYETLHDLTNKIVAIDHANSQLRDLIQSGSVRDVRTPVGVTHIYLDSDAIQILHDDPALKKIDLEKTPVDQIMRQLQAQRGSTSVQQQRALSQLADPITTHAYNSVVNDALVWQLPGKPVSASLTNLAAPGGVFRVPLNVGAMKPPAVGDLILVEQELRRYELGELAEIESIMKGERRERTIRTLARTSQTTTTETSAETEETSSLKTDERFQLSSQAQTTAAESFGVQTGVNVSAKFGPVQVGASVNASFDTSKSSTETTAQEYAKTVTEEASKSVRNSIKQTSSITILTETQNTSLRGFNNENGAGHINGLYRWVDKIYTARLLNYGRRLMISLTVPEPSAFYRGLLTQKETELMQEVVEPVPPSMVSPSNGLPYTSSSSGNGFQSYEDISESNYAKFAALYEVAVEPPPIETITGAKSLAVPVTMDAAKVETHTSEGKELSYVSADNTLSVDPGYRLTSVGVYVPTAGLGLFGSYADTLKLGEGNDKNRILVEVGDKSFYFNAFGEGGDKHEINTNFNTMMPIHPSEAMAGVIQPALPITIAADFEGLLTLTVMYEAARRTETLDQWKARTYDAIVNGYNTKKQEYDQALTAAQAKVQSSTEAQTYQLREDQYRSIELTELKRGCIDLLTEGTAAGYTSISVASDGTPRIVYDEAEGNLLSNWRTPLANGAVAEFFETAFEWEERTYQFYPYYWTASERWKELAQASGADLVFEQFLRAGSANVVIPVRPGYERSVILFLKTGLIWGGGYLPLFTNQDMLDVYADVELGGQLDPPEQVGDSWEIRLPTSLVMLQEGSTLPEFPEQEVPAEETTVSEPVPDELVPF